MSPDLAAALAPLAAAVTGAVLAWLERKYKERALEDAKTPSSIRRAWDRWLRDRLRDKDGRAGF